MTTLTPKVDTGAGLDQEEVNPSRRYLEIGTESGTEKAVGSNACSLCGITFYTVEDQKSHIRSDLHGYNLKQRIRGATPVSEADFEKLVGGYTI